MDYEELSNVLDKKKKNKKKPDSFSNIIAESIYNINFKMLFFLLLIFLFLTSDTFVDRVLSRINGATEHKFPTLKGLGIQLMILALLYIIFDKLISNELI